MTGSRTKAILQGIDIANVEGVASGVILRGTCRKLALQWIVPGGRESPAEHSLMQLNFVVAVSESAAVKFHDDGQERIALHGVGRAVENFRFESLDVNFHDGDGRSRQNGIQWLNRHANRGADGLAIGNDVIHGMQAGGKCERGGCRANGDVSGGRLRLNVVEPDIVEKVDESRRDGLKRQAIGSRAAGGQNGVAADICADVDKKIAGSQGLEDKCHIFEILKAAIDVSGGALHSRLHEETCGIDKRDGDGSRHEAAAELPTHEVAQRRGLPMLVEGVPQNEGKGFQ